MQYQLVPEENLTKGKAAFEPVTSCHAYSLHAARATSGEALYVLNHGQDRQLYDDLKKSPNCLLDNRWAAVKCPAAVMRPAKAPKAVDMRRPALPPRDQLVEQIEQLWDAEADF